jgi:hypothetical protein
MPTRWIASKALVLIEETSSLGMTLDQAAAELVVRDRLQTIAGALRVTEAAARRYLNDDTIRDLARSMVASLAEEQPGLDLAEAEPDTEIDPRLAALAVTALSEAVLVHLANPTSVGSGLVGECIGMLSIHGTRLYQSYGADAVVVSRAWLLRAARYIESAADTLDSGGVVGTPTDLDPSRIVASFRSDAELMRAVVRSG